MDFEPKKRVVAEESSSDAWMISYADMMSMLLAVFVVLFSMSTFEKEKFKEVSKAVSTYLTSKEIVSTESKVETTSTGAKEVLANLAVALNLENVDQLINKIQMARQKKQELEELTKVLETIGVTGALKFSSKTPKFEIVLPTDFMFYPGSSKLRPNAIQTLRKIGPTLINTLTSSNKKILIEGHSDSTPNRGGTFRSNFGLSALRAETVLLELEKIGISTSKMMLKAAGPNEPLFLLKPSKKLTISQKHAKNRRVVISIIAE